MSALTTDRKRIAIVANSSEYLGRPAVTSLLGQGCVVACHDATFRSEDARRAFKSEFPDAIVLTSPGSAEAADEAIAMFGQCDILISNDGANGATLQANSREVLEYYEENIDLLAVQPVRLLRRVVPVMRKGGGGSILFVTSGAPLRNPILTSTPAGLMSAGYTSARAAIHALVRSLAVVLAECRIQVNAVAPYYANQPGAPSPADNPAFQAHLSEHVPWGRLGREDEAGALIAALTSGNMDFVSGQIIAFSGAGC